MITERLIEVCVVIVNFRTPDLVIDCLQTLLPALNGIDACISLVDNHSGDNSLEILQSWLVENDPNNCVHLIESESNSGFAGGNNMGIKAFKARYYLLLNSDTLVRLGAIRKLLDTAKRYPEAGLVSPRLEWPDGIPQISCFRFPTVLTQMLEAAQTDLISMCFRSHEVPIPISNQIIHPPWTSFACVLIRQEVIEQVGLLDEGYFMYFDDIDYCYRTRAASWDIVHNPDCHIVHLRGGSGPVKAMAAKKKRLPCYYYESRARFYYKVYGHSGLILANLLWWLGRTVSKIRQIFGRSDKASIERQWLDIWINWRNPDKPYTHPKV